MSEKNNEENYRPFEVFEDIEDRSKLDGKFELKIVVST